MWASMEYLHLKLGTTSNSFFNKDEYDILWPPLTTSCWLKYVWQIQEEQAIHMDHEAQMLQKQTPWDNFH
jgi:hypothetical protein